MSASPAAILAALWHLAGGRPQALDDVAIDGAEPTLPSPFRIGAAAGASIAAAGLAAAELWRARTGRGQQVAVDLRAATAAFRSERHLRVDGGAPADLWNPIAGFYATGDGRHFQLHTNFPHHLDGVLRLLGVPAERAAVAAAIRSWRGQELEDALAAAGLCAALVRTPGEWRAHPQAAAVAGLSVLEIRRIGDAPPEPLPPGQERPLGGIRVLDLTRIIAGPVAARTLAEHGADVLLLTAAHLPSVLPVAIDTGRGKRSAQLDLRQPEGRAQLAGLVRGADMFVQGYRPGALAGRGFGPDEVARLRPGIVYVTLCAYGHAGPWAGRRGFDSLVQSASGIAWEGGRAAGLDGPKHLPAQALDHATGYLAAFGAQMALLRRAQEGGSWLVRVALATTGRWFDGLGRLPDGMAAAEPSQADYADLLEEIASPFGRLACIRPAVRLSETPVRLALPPVPLGTHPPAWA